MAIRIGVSGWSYKSWEKSFYPEGLARRRHLEYLTHHFNSVEVNASFYRLQSPSTFESWRERSPAGFVYAVKGGRFISHNKKLRDAETPLANFFASGVLALGDRLGPILWQLPSALRFDAERISGFLELLPHDTAAAAALARRHDFRVKEPYTRAGRKRRIRHALEVRHESYRVPELARELRRHRVALVVSDAADWPLFEEVTASFLYIRMHGSTSTYASRYTDEELDRWAERIRKWAGGGQPADAARISRLAPPRHRSRDVYVYFDNDQQAHAPHDAMRLAQRLGVDRAPADASR
jgi:uncharacterized protein YecE (DUF72 family)